MGIHVRKRRGLTMTLIATAFCLLAVTNFGSAAGIRLSEKSQEFTLEDVVHFERKVESVDVETRTIDPSIEEDAGLSVVSIQLTKVV